MEKYDICYYKCFHEDNDRFEYRPGILLSNGLVIPIIKVTGAEHGLRTSKDYLLKDWDSEGLKKPSIARCDKIQYTPKRAIRRSIGHLSEDDIQSIESILNDKFEESLYEDYKSMLASGEDIMTVAFGRMSVPTIGHMKLVKFMAVQSKGVKARLYLSHKTGLVSDPLPYEDKLYWCKKAFEPMIDVVESPLNSPLMILSDIYRKDGYTGNVLYVCGEDRLEEAKKWKKYNGEPDKKGKLLFDFADYDAISAGDRNKNSSDLLETVSGTMVRQCVLDGDFDRFKKLVPFDENDAEDLYEELEESFKALGALGESLTEASILSKKKYVNDPEVKDNLEKELDDIDPKLTAPNPNMDIDSYRLNPNQEYQGLFVKQGTRDNVSFSKPDVANYAETILNDNGEKVVKELSDMTFKDSQGKDYRLYPSGSRMGKGASFTAKDSTYYQEALQMLLLTNKLKYNGSDLTNYLLGSDPEGNIGVFDQIIVKPYKDISIFRQCWTQFVQTWKKSFEVDVKESDKFISEVSRVFGGSSNLIPLHDGINSKYSQLAGSVLTQQKDFIDKSDGYVFNGEYLSEMSKIFSTMASLLKEKKAIEYVKYVQQNRNKVVGVSLKKNNGSELVVDGYDIQRNSDIFTGRLVLLGTGSGRSWSIRFETDDKPIGLDIRPAGDAANKIEFRVPGSPANGNAIKALQYVFGDKYETFGKYLKGKDFESAAKWLCSKFVGLDSIESNTTYTMTDQGLNLIKRIFNLASGFEASDDKGNKITAPYIKVH